MLCKILLLPPAPPASDHAEQHDCNLNQEVADDHDQNWGNPPPTLECDPFTERRQTFRASPPCQAAVSDLAAFYTDIMRVLIELAETAESLAGRNNVVQ